MTPISRLLLKPFAPPSALRRHGPIATLTRFAVLGGALFALAACAAETPGKHDAPPPPPPQITGPGALGGHWMVSAVYPSGLTPLPPMQQHALVGRVLTISDSEAQDVDGRQCPAPTYQFATMPQSRLFAYRQPVAAADHTVSEISVSCHGTPFTRFVMLASGTFLADHHGTWVALSPAAAADHHLANEGMMVMMESHTIPVIADAPMPQTGTVMAHLASYRSEGMAREGWGKLLASYPALRAFKPHYEKVTLGKKGTFIRLMAMGASAQRVNDLCHNLKSKKTYCVVMKTQ